MGLRRGAIYALGKQHLSLLSIDTIGRLFGAGGTSRLRALADYTRPHWSMAFVPDPKRGGMLRRMAGGRLEMWSLGPRGFGHAQFKDALELRFRPDHRLAFDRHRLDSRSCASTMQTSHHYHLTAGEFSALFCDGEALTPVPAFGIPRLVEFTGHLGRPHPALERRSREPGSNCTGAAGREISRGVPGRCRDTIAG